MNIRKAKLEDAELIHELGKNVDEFSVSNETVSFWPKELLTHAIQSNDVLVLIAEDDSVAGFLIVNYNSGLKKALIENIYVHPDKRGRGIGEKLIETMLTLLADLECEYVSTLAPPNAQDAINLYRRNGFNRGEMFVWLDKALGDDFKK